jgi:hypothetical protein
MNIYIPYTYVIGWSSIQKYYYGVRYAKNCNPSDLWVSYFTSSKQVAYYRKQFGEPDIIQIRKTFADIDTARLWEHRVLKRLNVIDNDKWLNQTDNMSFSHDVSVNASKKAAMLKRGVPHSDIHKQRISEALSGKKKDPKIAIKAQMTKELKRKEDPNYTGGPPKGKVFSEEHKRKISDAKKGRPGRKQSEEEKQKRSNSMKGNKNGFRKILGVPGPL